VYDWHQIIYISLEFKLNFMVAVNLCLSLVDVVLFRTAGLFKHYTDIQRAKREAKEEAKAARLAAKRNQTYTAQAASGKQCFTHPNPYYMEFDSILDRSLINDWVPACTAEELKARGWDGKIGK
jgi:hypothetical protein